MRRKKIVLFCFSFSLFSPIFVPFLWNRSINSDLLILTAIYSKYMRVINYVFKVYKVFVVIFEEMKKIVGKIYFVLERFLFNKPEFLINFVLPLIMNWANWPFALVPGEPVNVMAIPINSSSVEVTWDPPDDSHKNGVIRGYQIYVQPKNMVC